MKAVETREGVLLEVHVKLRPGDFKALVEGDDLIVYSSEKPRGGRVNRELVKELSRLFHRKVELVSGFASKDKLLLVRNAVKSEIEQVLSSR